MTADEPRVIWSHMPNGVWEILAIGSTSYIRDLGNNQVLKYPLITKDRDAIEYKAHINDILGSHPRILRFYGLEQAGLYLSGATNGTLRDFLNAQSSAGDRLKWSRQLAEAVEYIHAKNVIHSDISLRNCIVTDTCELQLGDFQGRYRAPGVTYHRDTAGKGQKPFCPEILRESTIIPTSSLSEVLSTR